MHAHGRCGAAKSVYRIAESALHFGDQSVGCSLKRKVGRFLNLSVRRHVESRRDQQSKRSHDPWKGSPQGRARRWWRWMGRARSARIVLRLFHEVIRSHSVGLGPLQTLKSVAFGLCTGQAQILGARHIKSPRGLCREFKAPTILIRK